jgi:hypothetical protein
MLDCDAMLFERGTVGEVEIARDAKVDCVHAGDVRSGRFGSWFSPVRDGNVSW